MISTYLKSDNIGDFGSGGEVNVAGEWDSVGSVYGTDGMGWGVKVDWTDGLGGKSYSSFNSNIVGFESLNFGLFNTYGCCNTEFTV